MGELDMERGKSALHEQTGRRQVIPIARPLRACLEEMPAGDNRMRRFFPPPSRWALDGRLVTPVSKVHELLVSAGLAKPRPPKCKSTGTGRGGRRPQSEITFHSLRHTATSLLKKRCVSEAVTRDLIGHESAEISRHYTHVEESAKRKAIAKLPDVTKL